jgi:hypothetical protein
VAVETTTVLPILRMTASMVAGGIPVFFAMHATHREAPVMAALISAASSAGPAVPARTSMMLPLSRRDYSTDAGGATIRRPT